MKRKKLSLLFMVFMITLLTNAQSRFKYDVNSSCLINNRIITDKESDAYKDYRDSKEKYLPGFDLTASIGFRFGDRLSLETGAGYAKNGYEVREERIIDPGYSPVTAGYYSDLYRFRYNNVYIPVHIRYSTEGRINYSIFSGTSFIFPVSEKIEYILRKEFGDPHDEKSTIFTNDSGIKKINFSVDIGAGLGYRFSDRINVILAPKISYYLLGNENTWARDNLYDLSMFSGEDRTTTEHLVSWGLSLALIIRP